MKKLFKFLCLAPLLFVAVSCNNADSNSSNTNEESSAMMEPTPVDVIVISGQSNAVGCTHANCITRSIGASKYQDYMRGFETIKIAYDCWTKDEGPMFYSQNKSKNNDFVKVMLGQGNSEATFGPEIGIAEALHETHANKLFLIKYACGASNLKDDWTKRDSPMYGRFVDYVKAQIENLKSKGYIPTIKAFCWMQGEGDSYDQYYQVYYDNLKEFVTNLRTDLKEQSGNKDFPFIDAGISNAKVWQYYRKVNEAKKQFADESENNYYIDTIAAGMHTDQEPFDTPDECHYDTESEVQLGHLFAEQFEPFLMK
ncbi:MAG: hypothetical protein J5666_01945 [Bacilli bacterium]|nr:hypothetical protein [Bacilli bacterium]